MPSFGITPASGYPPATDQGFPRFIQWQADGVDVGSRALVETVNIVGAENMSVNSGGDTLTVEVSGGGGGLTWRDVPNDYTVAADDADNGLAVSGNSGSQIITVPGEDVAFPVGKAVLVFSEGSSVVEIAAASGVQLLLRNGLSPQLAGQYAIATLIKRAADTWVLCGDLLS